MVLDLTFEAATRGSHSLSVLELSTTTCSSVHYYSSLDLFLSQCSRVYLYHHLKPSQKVDGLINHLLPLLPFDVGLRKIDDLLEKFGGLLTSLPLQLHERQPIAAISEHFQLVTEGDRPLTLIAPADSLDI